MTHDIKKHDLVMFKPFLRFRNEFAKCTGIVLSDPIPLLDAYGYRENCVNVLWLDDKGSRTTTAVRSLKILSKKQT